MITKDQRKAIHAEMNRIAKANGGRLTPDDVVECAREKDSPMHSWFEWNQSKAAHQYRLYQARELIASIKIEVRTEKTTLSTVAYVRDPTAEHREQGYVSTLSLTGKRNQGMARDVLVGEFTRARSALQRARDLAAVFSLEDEIDLTVERIEAMRVRVEGERAAA